MKLPKGELEKVIRKLFEKKSDWSCEQLYALYPDESKSTLRVYRNRYKKRDSNKGSNIGVTKTPIIKQIAIPLQNVPINIKPQVITKIPPKVVGTSPPYLPNYDNINIKSLLKNSAIDEIVHNRRNKGKAWDILSREEFLHQAEIKHGVFWNSDMPPYQRPSFLYRSQVIAIDLMKKIHFMHQASRQKPGKTTAAFVADFEDMLETPGTVVTIVAPGKEQALSLMRQGFKEVLTLDDGTKFDLWEQLYKPYFIVDNAMKKVMKNGSMIQVITLSEFTTPGYATDVLHIEEIDKAVKDPQKLRGLAAILPSIRARRGKAKIRITCNNKSGVYRVLREEIKEFGMHFLIYMEKPHSIDEYSGEHFLYNEHIQYICPECRKEDKELCTHTPDIDEILKVLLEAIVGKAVAMSELGNVDDYEGEMWNPDNLDIAYAKGKNYAYKNRYEHTAMGCDPGAVHNCAFTIWAKEGRGANAEIIKLWTGAWSISGKDKKETESLMRTMMKTVAKKYIEFDCEFIASESNSGAHLIIPTIGYYVKKNITDQSFAVWREIFSNFGGDKEQGEETRIGIARADYIMLMQYLVNDRMLTLPILNDTDRLFKLEMARYDPREGYGKENKYKGDTVDASLHCLWHLCGGYAFLNELLGVKREKVDYRL